jgi:hypothetical protein
LRRNTDAEKPWLNRQRDSEWRLVFDYMVIGTRYRHEDWRDDGYLILKDLIPHDLIDAYAARYQADNGVNSKVGYRTGTPYMQVLEIKEIGLYKPLIDVINSLIGEEMGMNLNLTDWQSTERNWHQDDYLNPPHVNGHYLACWIALDDISPDSGPFEFVPGSHKWPVMRGEKVKAMLSEEEQRSPNWPRTAERFLDGVFERKIYEEKTLIQKWDTAKKGDVLIWHSWLAHRGSKPNNPELLRKSLIIHYSGINHRPDMQPPVLYESEKARGYFFPF